MAIKLLSGSVSNNNNHEIFIGFTVGENPQPFYVKPKHTIVTGMTGQGKGVLDQTMLEGWPGEQKCVVFVTKADEEQFKGCHKITPFYKQQDTEDWRTIKGMIEVSEENTSLSVDQKVILAQMTKGTHTLEDVLKKMQDELAEMKKGNSRQSRNYNALYLLTDYMERLVEKLHSHTFTSVLTLEPGINVMDISKMAPDGRPDLQAAVVGATLWEIYANHTNVTSLIMEAGKIIPNIENSPALQPAKLIAAEGRVKNNWIIFDLQNLKGLHADVKPNVDNYFLSKQKHGHEIERMREAAQLDPEQAPTVEQIKALYPGMFYAIAETSSGGRTALVYVKPKGMSEEMARDFAAHPEKILEYIASQNSKQVKEITKAVAASPRLDNTAAAPTTEEIMEMVRKEVERLNSKAATPSSEKIVAGKDLEVRVTFANINVIEQRAIVTVNAKEDLRAQLCDLVASGFFESKRHTKEVHAEIYRLFGIKEGESYWPSGNGATTYRKNKLVQALEELSHLDYLLLQREGDNWIETDDARQRCKRTVQLRQA